MPVVFFRSTGTLAAPELLLRRGGGLKPVRLPVTCAVVQRSDGLLLIDTGWSRVQTAWPEENPGRLVRFFRGMTVYPEDALASQLVTLGYEASNVRHIVATHLHAEHISGAVDFPDAVVHTSHSEWTAWQRSVRKRRTSLYRNLSHRIVRHPVNHGPALGFPASRDLLGDGSVLLLDASGHTHGSVAVAIKLKDRWLLHIGDACLVREQYSTTTTITSFHSLYAHNDAARRRTLQSILTAERDYGAWVVPSHDPAVFASLPQKPQYGWPTHRS